jgi:HSP20 family protein
VIVSVDIIRREVPMRTVAIDPFRALRPLREEEVEQLTTNHQPTGAPPLAYDVYRVGDELVIEFDAPGVAPSDVNVAVEGRAIAVSLRRDLAKGPGVDVIESGRQHGSFHQRLWLGDRWDLDGVTARAENGVLVVRAPLAAEALRRRVPVTGDTLEPSRPSDAVAATEERAALDDEPAREPVHTAA